MNCDGQDVITIARYFLCFRLCCCVSWYVIESELFIRFHHLTDCLYCAIHMLDGASLHGKELAF